MDAQAGTGKTATKGRSRATPVGGYFGEIPDEVWNVVDRAWYNPPSLSSNYAREYVQYIALASSLGWISIIAPDGQSLSRAWHVTSHGLAAYRNRENFTCHS